MSYQRRLGFAFTPGAGEYFSPRSQAGDRWHPGTGVGESLLDTARAGWDTFSGPLKDAATAKVREEAGAGARAAVEPMMKNAIMISAAAGVISLVALYFSQSKR